MLPTFAIAAAIGVWPYVVAAADQTTPKERSVFYPSERLAVARSNAEQHDWAARIRQSVIDAAAPWLAYSEDELWDMPFGASITRSWMVWSNGFCPSCREPVPMYEWRMRPHDEPWKVRCPRCNEAFPKNDFAAFYRSGLDEHGVFLPELADRSLLYNTEHPEPDDPLHGFGVDDGEGYLEGGNRWRFIGAYLIYGQWKGLILAGIKNLAAAYVLTGDIAYARKAGVLLDRVADLYPTYDFAKQGLVYEKPGVAGYVSTWHDACEEVRELALAYDQAFEGMSSDPELVQFLGTKAAAHNPARPKSSFADIQRNIEEGIFRDTIHNDWKIRSNYPRTDIALWVISAVLDWPANRDELYASMDAVLETATAVDGVTGEKGLSGYAAYAVNGVASFLAQFSALEPEFVPTMLKRHPRLHDMLRFHIDTWCLGRYYPLSGDCGVFAHPTPRYVGVSFTRNPGVGPSMFSFMWRMYQLTNDPALAQVIYLGNGEQTEGLPWDLFAEAPDDLQRGVAEVVAREGPYPRPPSANKQQWCIALLRSGEGANERVLALDYDAGGGHGHLDGMNLGLFAKGLDLMPDFGYPPVQYGGWSGERFMWYLGTPSHNTVVVDGANQLAGSGKTTLWADGDQFRAIRASAPSLYGCLQYERTAAMVDTSPEDSYVLDVFRVVGGTDHAKFVHSHFGTIETRGIDLTPAADYGHGTVMRRFTADPAPPTGWSVDWTVDDLLGLLPEGDAVHLRYTDLTHGAEAGTCEGWVSSSGISSTDETWIPRVMVRRRSAEGPLASTFVAVLEPYGESPSVASVRRLPLLAPDGRAYPDSCVAVEVNLVDGRRDLLVLADPENPLGIEPSLAADGALLQPDWRVALEGELCWVRLNPHGQVERVALARASRLTVGDSEFRLGAGEDYIEVKP